MFEDFKIPDSHQDLMIGYHFTPTENLDSIFKKGLIPVNAARWSYEGYLGECFNCGNDHWKRKVWRDYGLKKYTNQEDSIWLFEDMPHDDVDLRGRLFFTMVNGSPKCFSVTVLKCYYEPEYSLKWHALQNHDTLDLTHTGTMSACKDHPDDDKEFTYHRVSFDLCIKIIPPENIEIEDVWSLMGDDNMKKYLKEKQNV